MVSTKRWQCLVCTCTCTLSQRIEGVAAQSGRHKKSRENLKPDKKEETYDHVMLEDGLRDMNLTATKEDLENIATTE